jgi:hypothetical protein
MPKAIAHHSAQCTRTSSSIKPSVFADSYEFTIADRSMEPRCRPGQVARVSPHLPLRGRDVFLEVKIGHGSYRSFVGELVSMDEKELRVSLLKTSKVLSIPRENVLVAHAVLGNWNP